MGYHNKRIEVIPKSSVKKAELYINYGKKSLSTIMRETGADIGQNGGLYDMRTFLPCMNVKANGVVLSSPGYNEFAYAWDIADLALKLTPNNSSSNRNYVGTVALIVDGVKQPVSDYGNVGGIRGRTAVADDDSSYHMYCSKDGTYYAKKPSYLRDELYARGCKNAVMYDGGGSSQCDYFGEKVYSSRIVHNLLLMHINSTPIITPPTTPAVCPYPYPTRTLRYWNSGDDVRWLQWYLQIKFGYNISIDGSFGPATLSAVRNFQASKGLVIDGYVGPATRAALTS